MWSNAADVHLVDTEAMPAKSSFHFDLAGLAQGLSETAVVAQSVTKLQSDLKEAEGALETQQAHVKDIKDLLTRATGEQKFQLKEVLKSAEKHVGELTNTVNTAKEHLNNRVKEVEAEVAQKKKEKEEKEQKEKAEKEAKE
jgi:uncharacterized membrane-anchored protein YjiN (DUF445 family)